MTKPEIKELNGSIAKVIGLRLLQLDVRQGTLAKGLGVTPATMSGRMHGTSEWKLGEIVSMCDLLGLDVGGLIEAALTGKTSLDLADGGRDLPIREFGWTSAMAAA